MQAFANRREQKLWCGDEPSRRSGGDFPAGSAVTVIEFQLLTVVPLNSAKIDPLRGTIMRHTYRAIELAIVMMIALPSFTTAVPAWAAGSNSTSPAPKPATPVVVNTRLPQLSSAGAGGCAQQYTARLESLQDSAIASDNIGLTAESVGVGAELIAAGAKEVARDAEAGEFTTIGVGLDEAAVGVVVPGDAGLAAPGLIAASVAAYALAATSAAEGVALLAEATGLATSVTGLANQLDAAGFTDEHQELMKYVSTLPDCNTEFTGTVQVSGGGVNVTGDSIFNNDVGVAANVNVEGDVNASQFHATQGISAVGGGIWIGDPTGTTFSSGITIGGGAVSGAGFGGAQAFTGDVNAIAIGNNASAMMSGSLALGLDSSSSGANAVAIGTSATANGIRDVVVGAQNSTDAGGNNTAVGNGIQIIGGGSSSNTVLGVGHQVAGSRNFVGGDPITVIGNNNVATGANGTVTGDSNVAIGDTVNVTGNRAIAVGNNAAADADDTTVIGSNAQANAAGSAAYGNGALASETDQQVFGTQANTYTTPGITSGLSRSRQSGPPQVVTSDAGGNLATDGGMIFNTLGENQTRISENRAGIAIAMALVTPSLQAGETIGVAVNISSFKGSSAVGVSAIGVAHRNVFGGNERLSFNASIGSSIRESSFGGHSARSSIGGRVGGQLTW